MDTNANIAALATLDECLLAAHNAAVTGNAAAAIAIHRQANEVVGNDGSPLEITVMGVIYSNIKIAGVIAAQELPPHALYTLDYGYGTVVPDTL